MRTGRTSATNTTVGITDQHTSVLVHCLAHEIEQVATGIRATLHPDATTLNWIGGRRVNCRPGISRIVSVSDVEVPFTLEVGSLERAGRRCAEKSKRGAIVVAGNHSWE